MNTWRQPGFWVSFLLIFLAGVAVLVLRQDTLRETAFTVLMFIALASSLNILMGYTGYVNFGHIVFFGLGGYFGFYLISDGGPVPYRYRVRPPSFINLTVLEDMCLGHTIADAVIILGSVDIVLGEVDR